MPKAFQIMESLPSRFQRKVAGNMRTTIQFHLTGDDGGHWLVSIAGGECTVREGEIDDAEATVTMDASDFVGINTGSVSAVDTFWSGRIAIEGNIDTVLALPPVMNWK